MQYQKIYIELAINFLSKKKSFYAILYKQKLGIILIMFDVQCTHFVFDKCLYCITQCSITLFIGFVISQDFTILLFILTAA